MPELLERNPQPIPEAAVASQIPPEVEIAEGIAVAYINDDQERFDKLNELLDRRVIEIYGSEDEENVKKMHDLLMDHADEYREALETEISKTVDSLTSGQFPKTDIVEESSTTEPVQPGAPKNYPSILPENVNQAIDQGFEEKRVRDEARAKATSPFENLGDEHAYERGQILESVGISDENIVLLGKSLKPITNLSIRVIDAFKNENGENRFKLELTRREGGKVDDTQVVTTTNEKLLKMLEQSDKRRLSVKRKRSRDASLESHQDVLNEMGAEKREEMRRSMEVAEVPQTYNWLDRVKAFTTTKIFGLLTRENTDDPDRKQKIAARAALGMLSVAGATLAVKGIVDHDSIKSSVEAVTPINIDTDAFSNIADHVANQAESAHHVAEAWKGTINPNDGPTYVIDRMLDAKGLHLTPDQLHDVYAQHESFFRGLPNTYTLPNGEVGFSGSGNISIPHDVMENIIKAAKEAKQ
jgi:hypothetical protein